MAETNDIAQSESEGSARGRRQYDRSPWTDGVHILLAQLKLSLDENTKATLAMASRINMFFLVPLAVCAMGAATWALFQSKISEHSWLAVMLGCLAQFFGEGIKKIIEGAFPWSKKAAEAKAIGTAVMLALAVCVFFAGCGAMGSAYERYDKIPRDYSLGASESQGVYASGTWHFGPQVPATTDRVRYPDVTQTPALK